MTYTQYIEETPFAYTCDVGVRNTERFLAKGFRTIPAWHCVECGAAYDKNHTVRSEVVLNTNYHGNNVDRVVQVYSAKSGYCPYCAKLHGAIINSYFNANVQYLKDNPYVTTYDKVRDVYLKSYANGDEKALY